MASIYKNGTVYATGIGTEQAIEGYVVVAPYHNTGDIKTTTEKSNIFEVDDICKVYKIGCIQAYEFIET